MQKSTVARRSLGEGPRSKDGGMYIKVYQRDRGEKKTAVEIDSFEQDGKLITLVYINNEEVGKYVTER